MTRLAWLVLLLLPLSAGCATYYTILIGDKTHDPRLERIGHVELLEDGLLSVELRYSSDTTRIKVFELDLTGIEATGAPLAWQANERTAGPYQVRLGGRNPGPRYIVIRSRAGEHATEVPGSLLNLRRPWQWIAKGFLFPLAIAFDLATFPVQGIVLMMMI